MSSSNSTSPNRLGRPKYGYPQKQGMYDPKFEKDSCGVGFVCHIKGQASRQILDDARDINCRMTHRGGVGYEVRTGDGAGILTGMPDKLMRRLSESCFGVSLPPLGRYAVGLIFLPNILSEREHCKRELTEQIEATGQKVIGWREVPLDLDKADLGSAALAAKPHIEQIFVVAGDDVSDDAFARSLYLGRKFAGHRIREESSLEERLLFYVCSLSSRVIVYKGMLTPDQLFNLYEDLLDSDYESHLAMVHSRFSTNTFPSWDRAQPNRCMSHNGEINTRLGNLNWMNAREGTLESELFGEDIKKLFPVIEKHGSDSAMFDNVLEFLLMSGHTLQSSVMKMIPESWQKRKNIPDSQRAFYEFCSCFMEPWDGPASVAFTDGHYLGAVLDRNGLRPSRYYITTDDRCIMASEVGVLPIAPEQILEKGRLKPGRMFLIDFWAGKMVPDEKLKEQWSSQKPYRQWLTEQRITFEDLDHSNAVERIDHVDVASLGRAFGYTQETLQFILMPMIKELRDPLGSMGNDSALAVRSSRVRLLYDYFKQLFAQVTNPAIDSIREEIVMALDCYIGPEGNLLKPEATHAHRLYVPHPVLTNLELSKIKFMDHRGWKSKVIDITFDRTDDSAEAVNRVKDTLDKICSDADKAIDEGASLLILSDRGVSDKRVPISALLAVGTLHHYLVKSHSRTSVGLVIESGEVREVHHFSMLIGYGADAINPYLAFETLWMLQEQGAFEDTPHIQRLECVEAAYRKAVAKGLLKVMAKMGISTLQSYKGAQIFEAVGLSSDIIDRSFCGTTSVIAGIGWDVLADSFVKQHALGFPQNARLRVASLPNPGEFHWRSGGESHMWDPSSVSMLQKAVRQNSEDAYWQFSNYVNSVATKRNTIRGLLTFKDEPANAIPLEQVESEVDIVKRFCTGAMSLGSISEEAHETLAIAMNRLGGKSNTGEGGEDPIRFKSLPNGDSKRSAIKQVASGRFGVTLHYLNNADEIQIKIVQGAKPGEGGELPGSKVDKKIASIRHSTPGVGLISPPPHHDIYSIEDMAQLIHDLKNANPKARISVKLGSEIGVGTVASGVTKAFADHLVIAGHDGGTGASPLTSIKHAGVPWELGVAETHHTLVLNNLRSRVVLQTDGQLKTGRDVAIAALLGAEEFGFSTAPLISLGCIMMRKCHLNTCPVGVATQDKELRKKFAGKPEHVVNYLFMVAKELRMIMASLGFRTVNEMIGRVDKLIVDDAIQDWKTRGLDLTPLLTRAPEPEDCLGVFCNMSQDHGLQKALDNKLIELSQPALSNGSKVTESLIIQNTDRVVGTMLSHKVVRKFGKDMLPDNTINFSFFGSAGQSFGAFLAKGITLTLEGDANDYVGKGLSGGRIMVYPPKQSSFKPEENIIAGNVLMYGATSGECYFRGRVAERFCVRNSGASAVVEGVGDHGCEYMTGGRVVVLGEIGRNFAAGMSGGIAYVWDPDRLYVHRYNLEMVDLEILSSSCEEEVKSMIRNHLLYTESEVAEKILANWPNEVASFIKVMPRDYKRVLEAQEKAVAGSEI